MSDFIEDEQNPFEGGGVPIPADASREEGEISEEEDDIDSDFIRHATRVITTALNDRDHPRAAPTHLTFSLPEARGTADPPANSNLGNDAGQAAADLLRNSLGLTEEGSALHSSIKSALGFHDAWLKQNQNIIMASGSGSVDAMFIDALLPRLNSASLSNGDDEDDDSPEVTAKKTSFTAAKLDAS
jgi:hypothetical protein